MSDVPGRSDYEPDARVAPEEEGWGSPVPAQYGSLHSLRPAPATAPAEPTGRPGDAGAGAVGSDDRWGVSSLLRRLHGDDSSEASPPVASPLVGYPSDAPASRAPDSGFAEPGRPAAGPPAGIPDAAGESSPADLSSTPAPRVPPVSPSPSVFSAGAVADTPATPRMVPGAVGEPTATQAGIDPAALGPALTGTDALLGGRARRRRPGRMRTRATVRHIDIGSVFRVSAVFWLLILVALVIASLLLWLFADAFGVLPSLDKSIRTLFSLKSFQLHPGSVAMYTAAGGIVIAVAGMIGTLIFALIYNLIADVVGGFRVELESTSAE